MRECKQTQTVQPWLVVERNYNAEEISHFEISTHDPLQIKMTTTTATTTNGHGCYGFDVIWVLFFATVVFVVVFVF